MYGAAATVGLISLMAGLALPADVGMAAHTCGSGRMAGFLTSKLATAQVSADAGLHKLYLADHDAEQLRRAIVQNPHQVYHNMQVRRSGGEGGMGEIWRKGGKGGSSRPLRCLSGCLLVSLVACLPVDWPPSHP